jgi:hypothetical protein
METRHDVLLKKIDGINKDFTNHKIVASKYWIEGNYKDSTGKENREFQITKRGCEFLAHKTTGTKGNLFTDKYMDKFAAMENFIEESNKNTSIPFNAELSLLKFSMNVLNLSDSGKISMLGNFGKIHKMNTSYLPSYSEEKITKPLSELLKQFNVSMSAISFNKILLEKGIIKELERNSSKGTTKKFKSIVNLDYGKNLVSPKNPKETQPHYYEDKFKELIEIVLNSKAVVVNE